MGTRGPAPTPTEVLKLRGSWRAKTRPGEPKPRAGAPRIPKQFTAEQRATWRSLCKVLASMNLLTVADGAAMERYVVYLHRWRTCEAFIAANGLTHTVKNDDPTNYVGRLPGPDGQPGPTAVVRFEEYPQVRESHRLEEALRKLEAQFGLTPAARARITMPDGFAPAPAAPVSFARDRGAG